VIGSLPSFSDNENKNMKSSNIWTKYLFALSLTFFFTFECQAGPIANLSASSSALQERDLDKDGVTDSYFSTDLKLTWFAGKFDGDWYSVNNQVNQFTFAGLSDWRLPKRDVNCTYESGPCLGDEMRYLSSVEFGRLESHWSTNDFFRSLYSWTRYAEDTSASGGGCCSAYMFGGDSVSVYFRLHLNGLAVHDGDAMPNQISEPETLTIIILGFLALIAARSNNNKQGLLPRRGLWG